MAQSWRYEGRKVGKTNRKFNNLDAEFENGAKDAVVPFDVSDVPDNVCVRWQKWVSSFKLSFAGSEVARCFVAT